jgi:NAD(P)-dependent dehydrogenase (short-subunit alcohol dehydrogenase family)
MSRYLENIFSLKNKIALVTGASRGIGAEIALAYVESGANVICVARSESTEKKQIEEFYRQCDVADFQQFQSLCESIDADYGGIDILVNAAGVSLPKNDNQSELERFEKTVSINLTATYQCCDLASRFMHNGGSIINITSIGAMQGFPNNPGYVASKGGVRALTKAMARDLCVKSIRVNDIAPGYIKTDMTRQSFENSVASQERINQMMIKRWGGAEDLIGAAIFLASNASSYMTGSSLIIDGGWTAKGM